MGWYLLSLPLVRSVANRPPPSLEEEKEAERVAITTKAQIGWGQLLSGSTLRLVPTLYLPFYQDNSLDPALKGQELGLTHTVAGRVTLALSCPPPLILQTLLSSLNKWRDLWTADHLIRSFTNQARSPPTPVWEPAQTFQNPLAPALCPGETHAQQKHPRP